MRSINDFALAVAASLTAILACSSTNGAVINVPGDFATIQAGIDAAVNGDEVVLADGTYTGAGNVNCTFGGKLITVRSASGNPEACIIDCQNEANTRGFTFDIDETSAAVLSGVTITNGNFSFGGAISCSAGPSIVNCRFIANSASSGGAVAIDSGGGAPTVSDCWFEANTATSFGGAIRLSSSSNPALFHRCTFFDNAANGGGAAFCFTDATFDRCRFVANTAVTGGALQCSGAPASVTLVNCLLDRNSASFRGGGIHSGSSDVQLLNCTIVENTASTAAGAIYVTGGFAVITVRNSIVFNNSPNQIVNEPVAPGQVDVAFSNFEDWTLGRGNIDDGPLFVDPHGADGIVGTLDDDFSIRSFSPCADSGDNSAVPAGILVDLAGNPRFTDDPNSPDNGQGKPPVVDMGCFEVQPDPSSTCPWDFNDDGDVGGADLGELLLNWGTCGKP